jgi:hypothetical protein
MLLFASLSMNLTTYRHPERPYLGSVNEFVAAKSAETCRAPSMSICFITVFDYLPRFGESSCPISLDEVAVENPQYSRRHNTSERSYNAEQE